MILAKVQLPRRGPFIGRCISGSTISEKYADDFSCSKYYFCSYFPLIINSLTRVYPYIIFIVSLQPFMYFMFLPVENCVNCGNLLAEIMNTVYSFYSQFAKSLHSLQRKINCRMTLFYIFSFVPDIQDIRTLFKLWCSTPAVNTTYLRLWMRVKSNLFTICTLFYIFSWRATCISIKLLNCRHQTGM